MSYAGIHALAQQGGIQTRYARVYPLLIDALLVIVLAAVLALRGAGLPSRILSWLTLLVLLVVAAGAEALHATGRRLPRDAAAITVAVLPWLLLLVTFVLLLAMLRHARQRLLSVRVPAWQAPAPLDVRARERPGQPSPSATRPPARTPRPRNSAPIVPGISSRLVSAAAAGSAAGRAAADPETADPGGGPGPPAGLAARDEGGPSPQDQGGPSPPDEGSSSPDATVGPAGSTPADIDVLRDASDVPGSDPAESPNPPTS